MRTRTLIGAWCAAVLAAGVSAPARGDADDHDHHHHHGVVVQAKDFEHAVTLVRDGLEALGAAVARGDMHALHELSDGVAVPARALGKLAAARPGAAPANLRAINTLGQDIATLVDAMHHAADAGKPEVVVAKWEQLKPMISQLDAVSPRTELAVGIDHSPTAGGKAALTLSIRNADGSTVTALDARGGSIMRVFVVAPGAQGVAVSTTGVDAGGVATLELATPVSGTYTLFCVAQPEGRPSPVTLRAGFEVGGDAPGAPMAEDAEFSKAVGGYLVRLEWPDHVHPGESVTLAYKLDELSNPGGIISEDIDAGPARFVGVSADRRNLVLATGIERAGAGEIRVNAAFPSAGLYLTQLEFRHSGAQHRAVFIVDVHDDH